MDNFAGKLRDDRERIGQSRIADPWLDPRLTKRQQDLLRRQWAARQRLIDLLRRNDISA
jgi:hypothetical protein